MLSKLLTKFIVPPITAPKTGISQKNIPLHHWCISTEHIRVGHLCGGIDAEPSIQDRIVEPCAEAITTENFIPQRSILQLFSAEQVFVFVQVAVFECESERIEIGGLRGLRVPLTAESNTRVLPRWSVLK